MVEKPKCQIISLTHDEALLAIVALRVYKGTQRETAMSLADRLVRECQPMFRGERAPVSRAAFK